MKLQLAISSKPSSDVKLSANAKPNERYELCPPGRTASVMRLCVSIHSACSNLRQALLASGKNPDAVFGARDIEEKFSRQQADLKKRVHHHEQKLIGT